MSVAEDQRLHSINYNLYLPLHRGSKRLFVMFDLFLDVFRLPNPFKSKLLPKINKFALFGDFSLVFGFFLAFLAFDMLILFLVWLGLYGGLDY